MGDKNSDNTSLIPLVLNRTYDQKDVNNLTANERYLHTDCRRGNNFQSQYQRQSSTKCYRCQLYRAIEIILERSVKTFELILTL